MLRRCVAADPKHGDEWAAVSKDVACLKWTAERVLKEVASRMALGKYTPEALEQVEKVAAQSAMIGVAVGVD